MIVFNLGRLPTLPVTLWQIGPSAGLAITGTLALSYNRSRVFFTCFAMAFALWLTGRESPPGFSDLVIPGAITINIFLISIYKERGTLTAAGLIRLGLLLLQIAAATFIVQHQWALSESLLNPIDLTFSPFFDALPYNQLSSLIFLLASVACVVAVGLDDTPITQGIVTAHACLVMGYSLTTDHAFETFFMAGCLYLGASIIRESYNVAYRD